MTTNNTLTLKTSQGSFVFSGAEVPEKISFGGEQMLNTHKMVGGLRVVDAMGGDDAPLSWSGIFLGSADASKAPLPTAATASGRARFLDYLRSSGQTCALTWGDFSYIVVVAKFTADYKKPYWIPFSISCEIVQDRTKAVTTITAVAPTSPTTALAQDASAMTQLGGTLGNATLSGLVAGATAALSAVTGAAKPIANGLVSLTASGGSALPGALSIAQSGSISSAITAPLGSAITQAQGAVAALQGTVSGLKATATAAIAAIPAIGGINLAVPVSAQAQALVAQATAAVQLTALSQLGDIAARVQANLALVANPAGNKQITTGGGNLYQLATQTYGDATRWTDIAQASGLSDPMTPGFNALTVPA